MQKPSASARRLQIVKPLLATLLLSLFLWALLSRGRIVDATESPSTTTASPMAAAPARLLPPVTDRFQIDDSPVIAVTKEDHFSGDGAEPGETITYTIVVTNESITDALGVTLSDTIDLHTTIVEGSLRASPMAAADAYDAVGNTRIAITPTNGLLANDVDPDDPAPNPAFNDGLTVVAFDAVSANGGDVTVAADGGFTYDPPAGFEGVDAFTYTIEDDHGLTNVGTVIVSVSDVIWYVDHTAAPGGDGRSHSPFDSVAAFNSSSLDETGDVIFLYEQGGGPYDNGITLLDSQQLIGQGVDLGTTVGLTPPLGSTFPGVTSNPTLNNTTADNGSNGVVLAQNNALHGLNVGDTGGAGITGANFGTLTVSAASVAGSGAILDLNTGALDAAFSTLSTTSSATTGVSLTEVEGDLTAVGGSIAGTVGAAFDVNGGTVAVTYPGDVSQSAAARIIQVQNRLVVAQAVRFSGSVTCDTLCTGIYVADNSGGTVNFSGSSKLLNTGANTAVTLSNNTGAAIVFTNGGLDIDTTSGAGFSATGGGTVIVMGTGNTVNAAGTAVNIADTVIGASGVAFESINVDGGGSSTATAIMLDDTGGGQFHVTGTGAAGSGGTLQNILADAITLNNTDGRVIFEDMIIEDIGNMGIIDSEHDAIHGQTVDGGLELDGVTIRRISDMAIHGAAFPNGDSDTVWNGLTITGSTFEDTNRYHVAGEGDTSDEGTVRIRGLRGTALIDGNTFQDGAEHLDLFATAGTLDLTVTANDFFETYKEFSSGSIASVGKICLDLTVQGAANATVMVGDAADASNANDFRNCRIASVRIANDLGATGSINSTVAGNAFLVTDHSSGIGGDFDFPMGGVKYSTRGATTAMFDGRITGNTFTDVTNADGGVGNVTLDMDQGVVQVLVDGNTFHAPGNAAWFVRADATSSFELEFDTNTYERDAFPCTIDPSCGGGYFGPGLFNRVQVQNGGVIDVTLNNEALAQHDVSFDPGNTVEVQVLNVGGGGTACASFTGNSSPHGYGLEESAGTLNLAQGASSITLPAQCSGAAPGNCVTVLDDNANTGGGGDPAADPPTVDVFGTVDIASSACNLPSGAIFSSPLTVANPRPGDALSLMDGIPTGATVHFDADTAPNSRLLTNPQESKSENQRPAIEDPHSTILLNSTDRPLTVTQAPTASASTGNVAFRSGSYRAKTALAPSIMPALATPGDTAILLADPFTLPGGETFTVTFAVTVADPLPVGVDSVQNQAAVMGSNFDDVLSVDPDPHAGFPPANGETITPLTIPADLEITKDDGQSTAAPGAPLTYTIVARNNGPNAIFGATVEDAFPAAVTAAVWTCAADPGNACTLSGSGDISDTVDLMAGSAVTYTAVVTVDSTATGTLANTASITETTILSDPVPANNTGTDTNTLTPEVDISLAKSDAADPVVAGSGAGNLTYTITATNNGPSDVSNVTVSETLSLPPGVSLDSITPSAGAFISPTWTIPDLDAGQSETLAVVLTVDATTAAGSAAVSDTATVMSADQTLVNTGDDSVTEATSIAREVDLAVSMTESADPVIAGSGAGNLTYVVTVENLGPSNASGVVLSDALTLPAGVALDSVTPSGSTSWDGTDTWTVGDLAFGDSETLTLVLTVGPSTLSGTDVIGNEAVLTAVDATETNAANDTASETTSVDTAADLVVAKSDDPDPVIAGELLTYTVAITNNGPSDAQDVVATDTFTDALAPDSTSGCAEDPAGAPTCSLGAIAAGGTARYTITALVDGGTLSTTITNTVTVVSTTPEAVPGDESAAITTTVNVVADLELRKVDTPDPVLAGEALTYTLTLTNNGPSQGWGVVVHDTFPLAYNHTGNNCGVFYSPPNPFEWVINDMPAGTVLTCVITGTVAPGLSGVITNTAFVDTIAFVTDPDLSNNIIDEPTTVFDNLFTIGDAALAEGDGGVTAFTFTISRTNAADPASVDVATAAGTATPGADYTALPNTTVHFAAGGSLTRTVTVDVIGDALVELDETFFVNLSNPVGGVIGDGQGVGTILNDDDTTIAYLPIVRTPATAAYPDLVVDELTGGGDEIHIVIRNQGLAPVTDAFWVDLYLDPDPPPAAVNETWPLLADYGAAWGVSGDALPLLPGDVLTLTLHDAYYDEDRSALPGVLTAGTPLYAQVDSANAETDYGAVLESHEAAGAPYNNIAGPVTMPVPVAVPGAASSAPGGNPAALPLRPLLPD